MLIDVIDIDISGHSYDIAVKKSFLWSIRLLVLKKRGLPMCKTTLLAECKLEYK